MLLPEQKDKIVDQYESYCESFHVEPAIDHFLDWLERSWEGQQTILKLHFELELKNAYDLRKIKKHLKQEEFNGR